ncbi:MAG TPA: AbrB/MazE/SpoVT family DNA-binding domain-containing protein [Terriglobales bacterium]|nr:AbrB/MazE/SpoVT family DNA-binding domain-containing protein [Terriglobales bacterium]
MQKQKQATITSKGQITVPREVRRLLGVTTGDKILFAVDVDGVHVRPIRKRSNFAKYRGIGNSGVPSGKKGISKWLRGVRGQ